jgi:hypothetical protein
LSFKYSRRAKKKQTPPFSIDLRKYNIIRPGKHFHQSGNVDNMIKAAAAAAQSQKKTASFVYINGKKEMNFSR